MFHELHACQHADAPTLVLSSGLGGSGRYWADDLALLTRDYRVLVYDHAGTGRSPAVLPTDYSIRHMAIELLALLDSLDIQRCHFMGHALGGLVGLELALLRPELLQSQVLINAWSSPNPHSARCFSVRKKLLLNSGPEAYVQAQALFLYPADWIAANGPRLADDEAHALAHFPDTDNLLRRIHALETFDVAAELSRIHTPTLLIANRDDMLVPWQQSRHLANALPNATLVLLEYGGHASNITDPLPFQRALRAFLSTQP
ncbi:pyrimidine utilization protein D [Pseudomonas syringae]|uniref:pyrimidine utilization protein D n=1 Tax=Pseudomonas syringae TaxID=317 RepID=UPI001F0D5ADA|nr:pyrimidine utilization protein D [Pseudomonas syringae]MCH5487386.1 pyrimidine utilization protein D [Pseudomonas syringae pv. syringae]MDO1457960.1 pyrimidine utilization protein D [Pseudomonas syringae pv. syringae]